MEQQRRIPRPIGITKLAYQYHQEPTKDNKNKLRTNLLKNYISESLIFPYPRPKDPRPEQLPTSANKKINKKRKKELLKNNTIEYELRSIQFEDLAGFMGLSVFRLQERLERLLTREGRRMEQTIGNYNQEYLTRATHLRLLNKSLLGTQQSSDWAEELKAVARAVGYKPGNILAANQAMGNELTWLKTAFDMVTKMAPNQVSSKVPNTAGQVNNYGPDGKRIPDAINSQFLTPTMAVKMLEEKGLASQDLNLDLIGLEHGLNDPNMPNVEALTSDAQGSRAFNPKDLIEIGYEAGGPKVSSHHEERREEEYGDLSETI